MPSRQINDFFFTNRKQKKIELVSRPGAFEGRLFDDHPDQFVSDEGDRVLLDQVDQVTKVLPRTLDIHKVHQALKGS